MIPIKKILLLILFLSRGLVSFEQSNRITIPLKTVLTNRVFRDISTPTVAASDSIHFAHIPRSFAKFSVRKWPKADGDFALYIFYGIDSSGRRGVIIDSDFDFDLAGEIVNYFPTDVKYVSSTAKQVSETTSPVEIKFPSLPSFFVKPILFNCCRGGLSQQDSLWFMDILSSYERQGEFKSGNVNYKFALQASSTPYFKNTDQSALIGHDLTELKKSYESTPAYEMKEVFFLNNNKFVFDSINIRGDTIWIINYGKVSRAVGPRLGEYAPHFEEHDLINDSLLTLEKFKGRFILLDFWGTWCGPCIELIPDLKKLREQYKRSDLSMVSIAFDEKELIPKLKSMIADFKMNWFHVFDDSNEPSNISKLYRVNTFPTTIVIDPGGKIVFRGSGLDDFPKLTQFLKKSIATKK